MDYLIFGLMLCSRHAPLSDVASYVCKLERIRTPQRLSTQAWLGRAAVRMCWLGWFKIHPLAPKLRLNNTWEQRRVRRGREKAANPGIQ